MTSPSCDWAYSVIPTVAVSPSVLTHSWVSANRIPLRSGILSPFSSFRMRPVVKGQRNDFRRSGGAPNVHAKTRPGLSQGRRHVRHPDVVAKREGDVARGHGAHPFAAFYDRVPMPRDTPIERFEAHEHPAETVLAGLHDRVAAHKVLVQTEGPVQTGLERIRGDVDVVAVEAHSRFEAQRVAGPAAGGAAPRGFTRREQRAPERGGVAASAKQFETVFAGISGTRDHARD